jgi:hypothetical protein
VPADRRFLLDADVLIQAHRLYYGFDVCPGFWDFLAASAGRVSTIDKVRDELLRGRDDDPLRAWITSQPAGFSEATAGGETTRWAGEVFAWAQNHLQYTAAAKKEFSEAADGWLVAHARAVGRVVVTREKAEPAAKRAVKVPDACRQFEVECIDTFALLRELGARFVLPGGR